MYDKDFSEALRLVRSGRRVSRAGWNGKGMFLFYVACDAWALAGTTLPPFPVAPPLLSFIAMRTVDGSVVPWLASQTDILAQDWGVVE